MNKEQEERSSMTEAERQRLIELAACERSHDPIIVDGQSSLNLEFDGPLASVYSMTNASNPTRFAAAGLIIRSVTVIVGGIAHSCPGIPAGGRCTVLIQGSRAAQKNKVVKVIGRGGGVVEIEFDNTEYAAQSTGTLSKKFGRKERKVKSVTIIDDDTGDEYACTGIPSDGKCAVVICDDHLPHARSPKGAADAE